MKTFNLLTDHHGELADTTTPVSIFLKVRDRYPHAVLLESSDYQSRDESFSYICCSPMASIVVEGESITLELPDGSRETKREANVKDEIERFANLFSAESAKDKYITNGLFGYMTYDAVQHFEDISLKAQPVGGKDIPDIVYHLFRFVIVVDHFKNHLHIHRHRVEGIEDEGPDLDELITLLQNRRVPQYNFTAAGEEVSNLTDPEYIDIVEKGRHHCHRGDVFQIVLSREFRQQFSGDEFNVYRALRSINPSPYLFYFDYGSYRIFGSSPEAQLTIRDNVARINPIAGTYRRTGDEDRDAVLAKELLEDQKENAEHVMLVDLARNDLSRVGRQVEVETFKDIHYYSHVIHMVSEVAAHIGDGETIRLAGSTFPAGTLTGAPKYRAMQLIDDYEKGSRSFYGGAIGFMGFDGEYNHAITIRSFLSSGGELIYQSGAGIVAGSVAKNELQEVNNKIAALRGAIKLAEKI